MRLPIKLIPDEIIQKYYLKEIEQDGVVYLKIVKGMYGLPQAGKIANELLIKRFTLVIDDFGIKFKGDEHATH